MKPLFRPATSPSPPLVTVFVEGQSVQVASGETVAAAVLQAEIGHGRITPRHQQPRMPYCMMGVCFDCLMEINGVPDQQTCQIQVVEGMRIKRQAAHVAVHVDGNPHGK